MGDPPEQGKGVRWHGDRSRPAEPLERLNSGRFLSMIPRPTWTATLGALWLLLVGVAQAFQAPMASLPSGTRTVSGNAAIVQCRQSAPPLRAQQFGSPPTAPNCRAFNRASLGRHFSKRRQHGASSEATQDTNFMQQLAAVPLTTTRRRAPHTVSKKLWKPLRRSLHAGCDRLSGHGSIATQHAYALHALYPCPAHLGAGETRSALALDRKRPWAIPAHAAWSQATACCCLTSLLAMF